ncbi:MAG: hypothetical protein NTU91_12555 [Chloroflexi bacterium]|nr:hypothetical protein [Chloroflexota bacterium]
MRRALIVAVGVGLACLVAGFGLGLAWSALPTPTPSPTTTSTPTPSSTAAPTETATTSPTETATATPAATETPTPDYTPTISPVPSKTPTPTATPELRGRVREQSNCRYGPGAAYLYEWGLYPANRVTVLGRNQDGSWVYVDPWTYVDYCWVKTSLLDLTGDVLSLPQVTTLLPYTEFYHPPTNVSATRVGDDVTVWWDDVWMSPDDDRGFLIEAWVCQDGQLIFTAINPWDPPAVLIDEAGCMQPSSGRIYTAEKHGYTEWRLIPWPPHPDAAVTPGAS